MNAEIRSRSLIISVVIHGALFLLLLFVVMKTTIPPFPETGGGGGVLVNIGYLDAASGEIQPMSANVTEDPQPVKAQPQPIAEEKIVTQDLEDVPTVSIPEKKDVKKTDTKTRPDVKPKTEVKPVEKPREADQRSLYQGKTTQSKSQGTATSGTGDQGDRSGDPLSNYTGKNGGGTGPGNGPGEGPGSGPGKGGISFDLSGRKLLRKPVIDDRSQETGKVVVGITVDKDGNVTAALPGVRGSTTTSAYLFSKAKEAAMKAKFNASEEGADIQKGTMTFVFLVQ